MLHTYIHPSIHSALSPRSKRTETKMQTPHRPKGKRRKGNWHDIALHCIASTFRNSTYTTARPFFLAWLLSIEKIRPRYHHHDISDGDSALQEEGDEDEHHHFPPISASVSHAFMHSFAVAIANCHSHFGAWPLYTTRGSDVPRKGLLLLLLPPLASRVVGVHVQGATRTTMEDWAF